MEQWRDHMILEYEIMKYDGDLGRPNVPLSEDTCRDKIAGLFEAFPSQLKRQWFDEETFGLCCGCAASSAMLPRAPPQRCAVKLMIAIRCEACRRLPASTILHPTTKGLDSFPTRTTPDCGGPARVSLLCMQPRWKCSMAWLWGGSQSKGSVTNESRNSAPNQRPQSRQEPMCH
jgi:hypothetical protein